MASSTKPTRTSTRIADRKKKKAAEAEAAISTSKTPTNKRKRAKRGPVGTKVTKAKAKNNKAPVSRTTKLRYFLTSEQLSEVIQSHVENCQPHEWVHGDFAFAAPGEVIPAGSLELSIKVPSGLDFLVFPKILKLAVAQGEMEAEMEEEEIEGEQNEESDSELSECGYVSDIHN